MQRRSILSGLALLPFALLGTGLLIRPSRALALGGVLPELEAPAPDFQLDGVAPPLALGLAQGKGQTAAPGAGEPVATRLALADFSGRWLVLYFYPKDFTSGCTLEARGFQEALPAFHAAAAEVVGISADDPEQHASFCGSEGLAYPLLSDPGGSVSRRYGSWIAPYSQRHTFLIDPQGQLRAHWTAVRPAGHAAEVLATLKDLQAGP